MTNFRHKLKKAKYIVEEMNEMIKYAQKVDDFELIWDDFWELSKAFPFEVEWCDIDTSYKSDILGRFNTLRWFVGGKVLL